MILRETPMLTGLYNLASEPISKYELLRIAQENFGIDVTINKEFDFTIDRSLNSEKFKADTGYIAPSWSHMMQELAKDNEQYIAWGIKL